MIFFKKIQDEELMANIAEETNPSSSEAELDSLISQLMKMNPSELQKVMKSIESDESTSDSAE